AAQACVPSVDLDFNPIRILGSQVSGIAASVGVMEMNSSTALTKFGIGGRPHRSCLKISFERLSSLSCSCISFLQIEVDHNMILRDLHIVELGGVEILESGGHLCPGLFRSSILLCVLSGLIGQELIQNGLGLVDDQREGMPVCFLGRLELVRVEPLVDTPHLCSVNVGSVIEVVEVVPQLLTNLVLRELLVDPGLVTELLVELVGLLQGGVVLRLEHVVIRLDEVEED